MNNFKTRELSLAALLLSHKIPLVDIEILTPETFVFVFENPVKCGELEEEYIINKHDILQEAKRKSHEN